MKTNKNISVLILTLNEEQNLQPCIDSVSWSDDVVVLDSFSCDKTVEIANKNDVRIFQRAFDNYAGQRNYGLKDIIFKNSWLLMIDADERVPEELRMEMVSVINNRLNNTTLFRMRRKDFLFGKWIKNSSKYPIWFGRLMKLGHIHVERTINEEYHTDGETGELKEHLLHYPFNKGFNAWIEKHNRYSSMEAELKFFQPYSPLLLGKLFHKDPVIRRKSVKQLFHRLPARPLLIFILLYILRGGFLEGHAGLVYCLLTSFYEFLIDCKVNELKIKAKGKAL